MRVVSRRMSITRGKSLQISETRSSEDVATEAEAEALGPSGVGGGNR